MPIKILSAELANQIAAGEVVERPASVVKELVENSLDAGATKIDIEIHRGGMELIRVRDNGCGIHKRDLPLALSRHATSKISVLEDLQNIVSMGFRGEALASISSVSRLQLTSRTAEQKEAWQAYTEGREMHVTIKPASHPVGSTIEVLNLFYNTPARRKFMRTEKTEWQHIDEMVRRLALSRFDLAIDLSHNSKLLRQYGVAKSELQKERRLLRLCGASFLQHSLALSFLERSDLNLKGWISTLQSPKIHDIQYFYVNQRMIRDRVVTHAIRQAYEEMSTTGPKNPSYVLYLNIDPRQLDVNVHPSKQEVRFHQARLVHDFIYQAITKALSYSKSSFSIPVSELVDDMEKPASICGAPVVQKNHEMPKQTLPESQSHSHAQLKSLNLFNENRPVTKKACEASLSFYETTQTNYQKIHLHKERSVKELNHHDFGRVLSIFSSCYALIEYRGNIALLSLTEADRLLKTVLFTPPSEKLTIQPLLIPMKLKLNTAEIMAWKQYQNLLFSMGIELRVEKNTALLCGIALELRPYNIQNLIPELLNYLSKYKKVLPKDLANWFTSHINLSHHEWTVSQAIKLLTDFERFCGESIKNPSEKLLQCIDLNPAIALLSDEKN